MTKEPKERLNLVYPKATKELLDRLQKRTGSATLSETIRRALALLDVVTQEQEKGAEVYFHYPDGTEKKIHFV